MQKYIVFSGAADKIAFLYGAGVELVGHVGQPDVYHGTSSGAICSLVLGTNANPAKAKNKALNLTAKDVFGYNPYSLKGFAIAIKNVISGKPYIWKYNKLPGTIKSIVTPKVFQNWVDDPYSPEIYVGYYDLRNKKYITHNLRNSSYEGAINAVVASCSIPFVSDPFKDSGGVYYDGGLINHSGAPWVLSKLARKYDKVYSIYSRPKKQVEAKQLSKRFTIFDLLSPVYDVMQFNTSQSDEVEADLIAQQKEVSVKKIFPDEVLMDGLFKTDKLKNLNMYKKGINATKKALRYGV
jgi:hypothetical protein